MDQVYGAAYYVAPEVLEKGYDEKVDMWSVGVIMYMLLSGVPPFQGETEVEIVRNVRSGIYDLEIPMLAHVTSEAKNLMNRLLKYNPAERYSA